ncbi:TPA: type II toxin-antitoxin system HicB family antitoxin [Legionella pneumophila]|uniref:type II toxin-antitoxin system HicB family antitoxin n=1 Tax=Legionellaceae TaxID=444 RepID=UPI0010418866|nr:MULTISPECIES: type II toxin-antitoxin system HicB family antitoxin [Legionellaceae]HAT2069226.1 type II toxin-antitoxin system HicB family antitoxin [Legionella pneumophila]MCH9154179.1 type II toxin-antitoxin system HicB family antitoxin [Legionella pneumophila serogroup 1]HAT7918595.1 type II toxin-antitoxin system HicB family antitoxin [Legionella pneumophila]HAT7926260.1 type II toxin-antitoxin system HicB family antitoxin [Legionella pneumophila]HAU0806434.1 type II toxin-antitoxin sys
MNLTAIYEKTEFGFSGYIEQLSGVNTQGSTLEETQLNLREALSMIAEIKGIQDYKISEEIINDKSSEIHSSS